MSRDYIHFDYEASSFIDIKSLGGYRYACDDSTQILMFAIAGEEGRPVVWDFLEPDSEESLKAKKLLKRAVKRNTLLYAWNAPFEHAVSRYKLRDQVGVDAPDINTYRCVAAMARRAALPNALEKCAQELQMEEQKEKVGKQLIACFSDRTKIVTMRPPPGAKDYTHSKRGRKPANRKSDSPIHGWQDEDGHNDEILWDWFVTINGKDTTIREAWEMFKEYCRQDVVVERDIHRTLYRFELKGQVLESFQFNMRMNDRGIPLNKKPLETALKIIDQFQGRVKKRFKKLTGLRPTQGRALLPWLRDRGYLFDNLQAPTVEKALSPDLVGDLKPQAKQALEMLQLVSFAALKKVPTMLKAMCPDGRVRGTMMWSVARTGRAGGRIVQPQNMKKATMETCLVYSMLCDGCTLEDLEDFWDSPLEAIACCVRHFIKHPTKRFFDADFTGVEARITPWLTGNQRKLDSVLRGEDQYLQAASMAFDIPYETLFHDYKFGDEAAQKLASHRRTIGKPIELSCCFGTGARGMRTSLRDTYGVKLSLKECKAIVRKYRDENPETVEAWREIEEAFIAAIGGQTSKILGGKVKIGRVVTAGIAYIVMKLPSGRNLYYPRAHTKRVFKKYDEEELEEEPWKRSEENWNEKEQAYGYWADEIRFWGSKDGKPFSWVATWGSRLFENLVQSIGADLLDRGCIEAERQGHPIFMVVHDQALCEENELGLDHFVKAFTTKDDWAETFPLDAEGNIVNYYLKD